MSLKKFFGDRKLVIRTVLFIVFFATAITAFTIGVINLAGNKEGYQTIEAEHSEEAPFYSKDFTFKYYFTGSSGEIRDRRKAVTALYSTTLLRAYKLLDPENTYDGFNNIASLNKEKGCSMSVGDELYNVLKDAYLRTSEQKGYNMFAGALYDYVYSILILEEPEAFDPVNDAEGAKRRDELVKLAGEPSNFNLSFEDDVNCTVSFNTSEIYDKAVEELEADAPALDLNLLKDAYILEIVGKTLAEAGYTDGYITSRSGLTVALSDREGMEYCIYGLHSGQTAILETLPSGSGAVFSAFKSFAFGAEDMYYTVDTDGRVIYRNPYISALDGYESDKYLSLYSVMTPGASGSYEELARNLFAKHLCADTVYRNLRIWAEREEDTESAASGPAFGGASGEYITLYVLQNDTETVIRSNN